MASHSLTPDRVLALAAAGNIITMPVDHSSVRFYHQLLQEYFAACQMRKRAPGTLTDYWRWPWLESEMPTWARPAGTMIRCRHHRRQVGKRPRFWLPGWLPRTTIN